MDIKTKFKVGQEVWYRIKGKIYHNIIDKINITVTEKGIAIYYNWEGKFPMIEERLYSSEKELLKNLQL